MPRLEILAGVADPLGEVAIQCTGALVGAKRHVRVDARMSPGEGKTPEFSAGTLCGHECLRQRRDSGSRFDEARTLSSVPASRRRYFRFECVPICARSRAVLEQPSLWTTIFNSPRGSSSSFVKKRGRRGDDGQLSPAENVLTGDVLRFRRPRYEHRIESRWPSCFSRVRELADATDISTSDGGG